MPKRNTVARILRNFTFDETTNCMLWNGPLDRDGYGVCSYRDKSYQVHRFAWEQAHGKLPPEIEVDHKVCHTRRCFNLAHLEPVSKLENLRRAGKYKLSDGDIQEIRNAPARLSNVALAELYDVDPSLISKIRTGSHR